MNAETAINGKADATAQLLSNIRDYSRAVTTLTLQRQSIFVAIAVLTGWFFEPWKAALFFSICMFCEYVDLKLASRVQAIGCNSSGATKAAFAGFVINTIVSALAISIYAVWVGVMEDGGGMFTALFCLFAASLYAAMRNHQIASALVIRLVIYGASFIFITVHDLWVYRPPLSSEMWLQFFTIVFVMYFLIDCSVGFFRMYRQDLKRLDDLQIEHERAKEALVLKTQFVAVISHELRTPLTSIKGSLDLINSGKLGNAPQELQSLLELAGKNSHRLANLVDDLLDIQKIEEGRFSLKAEIIDVQQLLKEAVASHEGLAEKHNVRLRLTQDQTESVYVHADPTRMMQVLGNIISNAAKFSPDHSDVEIWYEKRDTRLRVFVRDHGVGIPPDSRDMVFGRFTQVDSSGQRQFGGTGLGMSIALEIVKASGGMIDYQSELGEGTTFFVELPIVATPLVS